MICSVCPQPDGLSALCGDFPGQASLIVVLQRVILCEESKIKKIAAALKPGRRNQAFDAMHRYLTEESP